ncbi:MULTISPECIES: DsbC family protein [Marinobacter]|uniref:Thiol:disulfide interchange protein n=1 Tax=Marinobacter xiaoshiensis TaxID=3073652 RepID=A0ABU2HL66_9GAMM|nr:MULTISPECIES: DsbC family protein [unclassified Marinobacter]MBK1886914.1 DsbC family protein [Marinobacter sp. DY40_1A1]MDS1311812.1 DsbC family protein [Marinobacter sp. F60267]
MNVKQWFMLVLMAVGVLGSAFSVAGDVEDKISERLSSAIPGLEIVSVRESEAKGLYEIQSGGGETVYATQDGQYLFTGDLLKVTSMGIANVTKETKANARHKAMTDFGRDGLISYKASDEKAVIDVFTDIDCPYCRKLHDEVPKLNDYGITVNYYAYPRSKPGSPSFVKYVSVWCAEDQQSAMNAAKAGHTVPAATCDNPVLEQYELGQRVGVTGTPAIVLEDGNIVPGFVPARNLAEGLGLL